MDNKTGSRKYWEKVLQKKRDIEVDNNGNTSERFYKDEENINENKTTQVDTEIEE